VQSLLGSFVADALKKDGVGRKTLTPPNAESMKLMTRQFLHISYQMDSVVNRFDEDYVSPQNPIRHYYKG
jgi:hypothetical protein